MPQVPEPHWVEMKGPINHTIACGDGCFYRTDTHGRVAVRPMHVPELTVRDRMSIANEHVEQTYSEAVSGPRRPILEDLVEALHHAAVRSHAAPPAEREPERAERAEPARKGS